MFPSEYAVEIETVNCGRVSLFAFEDKVSAANNLVKVEEVGANGSGVLVRLPSVPFEITSRIVRVSPDSVVRQ